MKKKPKYRNIKTVVDGITFDSKREAAYYGELKKLAVKGDISDIAIQPIYPIQVAGKDLRIRAKNSIGRKVVYKADFSFVDSKTGNVRIIDVKGMDTPVSRLKRAIIETLYGIEIEVVR